MGIKLELTHGPLHPKLLVGGGDNEIKLCEQMNVEHVKNTYNIQKIAYNRKEGGYIYIYIFIFIYKTYNHNTGSIGCKANCWGQGLIRVCHPLHFVLSINGQLKSLIVWPGPHLNLN